MAGYSQAEIEDRLNDLQGWSFEDGQITRTFEFATFMAGIEFVRNVAAAAEDADHHPDIDIRYSKITIAVSSHDVGGITDRDFALATTINGLA